MPFNGSGSFSPPGSSFPAVANTLIEAAKFNAVINDICTNGLSNVITKDGQTTVTANIPMAGFKFTGLGAGAANGDSVRWQQSAAGVMTTTGDMLYASAANTPARLPAAATVAAHATTMDPWGARVVTLSGSAVTFTDMADAPYVGAQVLLIMNAAHVFTDGAVFDVQGGANYIAAAGDLVLLTATAVDAFDVTVFRANGVPMAGYSPIVLGKSGAAVAAPADTSENTVATITIPANAIGANGLIRWAADFTCTNNANTKTVRVKIGGTTIASYNIASLTGSSMNGWIRNANATNAQVANSVNIHSNATQNVQQNAAASIDTTSSTTVTITVEKASAGDTVTLTGYNVEVIGDGA